MPKSKSRNIPILVPTIYTGFLKSNLKDKKYFLSFNDNNKLQFVELVGKPKFIKNSKNNRWIKKIFVKLKKDNTRYTISQLTVQRRFKLLTNDQWLNLSKVVLKVVANDNDFNPKRSANSRALLKSSKLYSILESFISFEKIIQEFKMIKESKRVEELSIIEKQTTSQIEPVALEPNNTIEKSKDVENEEYSKMIDETILLEINKKVKVENWFINNSFNFPIKPILEDVTVESTTLLYENEVSNYTSIASNFTKETKLEDVIANSNSNFENESSTSSINSIVTNLSSL